MKKIILVIALLIFSFSFSLANFVWEISDWKEGVLEKLNTSFNAVNNVYQNLRNKYSQDKSYLILKSIDVVNISDYRDQFISEYFRIDNDVVTKLNELSLQIRVLERQKDLEIITTSQFDTKLNELKDLFDFYISSFSSSITSFEANSKNSINNFDAIFLDKKIEYDDIISDVLDIEYKVNYFLEKVLELQSSVDKVNRIYVWSSQDIHNFMSEFRSISSNNLRLALNREANDNYSRYRNLKNSSENNITSRINSIVNEYNEGAIEYFSDIIEWFYNEVTYKSLIEYKNKLKSEQFEQNSINYSSLLDLSISNLEKNIDLVNQQSYQIKLKLEEFDNAEDFNEIRANLIKRADAFYDDKFENSILSLDDYIKREIDYLSLKSSRQLESYNNISSRINSLSSITSISSKLQEIDWIRSSINLIIDDIIDLDIKSDLYNKYWELYVEKIENQIRLKWLIRFNIQYRNVENILLNILNNMYIQSWNNWDLFKSRVSEAITRAEWLLNAWWLSQQNEYVLLRIKQSMIRFLYLE